MYASWTSKGQLQDWGRFFIKRMLRLHILWPITQVHILLKFLTYNNCSGVLCHQSRRRLHEDERCSSRAIRHNHIERIPLKWQQNSTRAINSRQVSLLLVHFHAYNVIVHTFRRGCSIPLAGRIRLSTENIRSFCKSNLSSVFRFAGLLIFYYLLAVDPCRLLNRL